MTADTAQGTLHTSVKHVVGEEGQIHGPDFTDTLGSAASNPLSLSLKASAERGLFLAA